MSSKGVEIIISTNGKRGFTLIEILVVITLLGILLGVVIVVIDVPKQRIRSRQAVAKANLSKACAAFTGCISSQTDGVVTGRCDTFALMGVTDPSGKSGMGTFTYSATAPDVRITQDSCTMVCDTTGALTMSPSASCYVQ